MKLWRPNANPIPRLVYLLMLHKKSWPVGPSLLLLLDIVVEAQIQHQSYLELWSRLKNLDEAIKRNTHFQKSEHTYQVIRNRHHSTQPYFLLVKGDIVCSSDKPMLVPCESHGTNEWRVLETTTRLQLEEIFRIRPLIRGRFDLTYHLLVSVASLLLGIFFLLTSISVTTALPFIIATLPLVRNLIFLYTNSRMHLLAEQLQKSTTGYDESQEIDEFDEEALPPTKDIVLGFRNTLSYMHKMLIRPSDQLFWNSDLTVSFGTVTFMNFLDKPYLLSMPFQLPDQILLPSKNNVSTGLRLIQGSQLNPFDIGLDLGHYDIEPCAFKAVGVGLSLFSSCNLRATNIAHPAFAQDVLNILCPCGIARALGFRPGLWKEYTVQESIVTPNVTARFISQAIDPQVHLFAIGDLGEILPFCSFSWSENEIIPFGQESRNTLMELAENLKVHGYHTVAISYRPCRPGTKLKLHKHNHVFLGFVIFSTHPRNQVSEFIHDLGAAGIRFVFFSTESEVTTKAFGSRLGLEMDWNSCILFSAPPTSAHLSASAFEFSDPKSKLPRGVQNVRPHLLNVDDIPLRLSLFAECDPESIAEMIKIYQENDEVVISVGLASSLKNLKLLAQADLGIVMDPPAKDAGSQAVLLESMITSILCPLRMPNDASLYFFTELLREARTLFRAMIASINLFVISQSFLFLSNVWTVWSGSTPNTVATAGVCLVFIPTLCFTVLLSDYESDCMKQMPGN